MRKCLSVAAAVAALFIASSGLASSGDLSGLPSVGAAPEAPYPIAPVGESSGYTCCWVFIFGRWWCLPCTPP